MDQLINTPGYKPQEDPEMPKVGDTVPGREELVIAKVEYISASDLIASLMPGGTPIGTRGYAELFIVDHSQRPFVKFAVWANLKTP